MSREGSFYRVTLKCINVEDGNLLELTKDIEREFSEHRTWHKDIRCWHEDRTVFLCASNDFDFDGIALLDEFGDAMIAYHAGLFGPISVVAVDQP